MSAVLNPEPVVVRPHQGMPPFDQGGAPLSETGGERQNHAGRRDRHRFETGLHQTRDVGLEPDLEQQQNDADLREQLDDRGRLDPSEQARAQEDTRHELADDGRGMQPCRKLAEDARGEQDREQN